MSSARGDFDPKLLTNSLSTGADSGYLIYPAIEYIPDNEDIEFVFHNKGKYFAMIKKEGDEIRVSGDEGWNIVILTNRSIHLLAGGVDSERDDTESILLENIKNVDARTGILKNKLILDLDDSHEYSEIRIPVQNSDEVNEASEFITEEPHKREQSQVGFQVWTLEKLYAVTAEEFESVITDLWRDKGYAAHTTQSSNDGGVDVVAKLNDEKVLIQAKRYEPMSDKTVGIGPVQRAAGLLSNSELNPATVIVATTANFTEPAKEEAEKIDGLELMNGISLATELRESNVPPEKYGYF